MKLAHLVVPHIGGTYAVYRALRIGLAARGIEVRWLGIGAAAAAVLQERRFAEEHASGEVVASEGDDRAAARCVVEHLAREGYDGVLAGALCGRLETNIVRYLPEWFLRLLIVHTITPGTYRAARAVRDHVHAAIGVSPRIRTDLVRSFGFDGRHTHVVGNAVDLARFRSVARRAPEGPLRLVYLGRLEEEAKGILWLPKILRRLADARLTVAGDGPDRARLENACARVSDRVTFVGRVQPDDVPGVLAEHDIFLGPSRFEGFGCAFVEAMAAGCVPVVSRISGVTDAIVQDGETGLLFPVGDVRAAAAAVGRLARDRETLRRMSAAARAAVERSFSLEAMAARYAAILSSVRAAPRALAPPLPIEGWRYPAGLNPGLRSYLPTGLKNVLRVWRERLA